MNERLEEEEIWLNGNWTRCFARMAQTKVPDGDSWRRLA